MKNRKQGFTLVELLVVMAIIAILAAIVVPNVARYMVKSRVTRAMTECNSIETSLVKMLADSNRGELKDLFNSGAVDDLARDLMPVPPFNGDFFKAALKIYTNTVYALLREGRGVLGKNDAGCTDPDETVCPTLLDKELNFMYKSVVDVMAVKKLGTNYLDIGFDPWGNMYNIWPGPWSMRKGPIVFRVYMPESDENNPLPGRATVGDGLTVTGMADPDTYETDLKLGYPASRNQVAFIWSNGANLKSSQAIYRMDGIYGQSNTNPPYTTPAPGNVNYYDLEQDGLFCCGGDDINNWDADQSWNRFYN